MQRQRETGFRDRLISDKPMPMEGARGGVAPLDVGAVAWAALVLGVGIGGIAFILGVVAIALSTNTTSELAGPAGPAGPAGLDGDIASLCCTDFTRLDCNVYCLHGQKLDITEPLELYPENNCSLTIIGDGARLMVHESVGAGPAIKITGAAFDLTLEPLISVHIDGVVIELRNGSSSLTEALFLDQNLSPITISHSTVLNFPAPETVGIRIRDATDTVGRSIPYELTGPGISNCAFENQLHVFPEMPDFSDVDGTIGDDLGRRWGIGLSIEGGTYHGTYSKNRFTNLHSGIRVDGAEGTIITESQFVDIQATKNSTRSDELGAIFFVNPRTNTPSPSTPSPLIYTITSNVFTRCGGPCVGFGNLDTGSQASSFILIANNQFVRIDSTPLCFHGRPQNAVMIRGNNCASRAGRAGRDRRANTTEPSNPRITVGGPGVYQTGPYTDFPFAGATVGCLIEIETNHPSLAWWVISDNSKTSAGNTWLCGGALNKVPDKMTINGNHVPVPVGFSQEEAFFGEGKFAESETKLYAPYPLNITNIFPV